MRHHAVITGTGRAGTTFLVHLLSRLGVDTGFKAEIIPTMIDANARAGLEVDIRKPGAPYLVKSPWFCDYADEVLANPDIHIDHVFIPMRELHAAAASRIKVAREYVGPEKPPSAVPGGLCHTDKEDEQEALLMRQLYKLLAALGSSHVPVILLAYPRLVRDPEYLYAKLQPLLAGRPYHEFLEAFREVVRPDWNHEFASEPSPDAPETPVPAPTADGPLPAGTPATPPSGPSCELVLERVTHPNAEVYLLGHNLDLPLPGPVPPGGGPIRVAGWVLPTPDFPPDVYFVIKSALETRSYPMNVTRLDVLRAKLGTGDAAHPLACCGFSYYVTEDELRGDVEIGFEVDARILPVARLKLESAGRAG